MKVWLYYRLSRDEDEELNSLNNQRKIIYNFAVSNGHEVVGESFDDNVSGMHFNREGIDKIYEVVEAGKIEAIIVKDDCVIIEPTQKDLENQGFVAGSICF